TICQLEGEIQLQERPRPLRHNGTSRIFECTSKKQMIARMPQVRDQLPGRSRENQFQGSVQGRHEHLMACCQMDRRKRCSVHIDTRLTEEDGLSKSRELRQSPVKIYDIG